MTWPVLRKALMALCEPARLSDAVPEPVTVTPPLLVAVRVPALALNATAIALLPAS